MPWDEIWKAIMAMGGVHPALFLLTCGVALYLARSLNKSEEGRRSENDKAAIHQKELFEKRLEEQRTTLQTLDRNALNMAARTAAIDSTVAAINELTQGFAKVVYSFEAHREEVREQARRLERAIQDIEKNLRDLK